MSLPSDPQSVRIDFEAQKLCIELSGNIVVPSQGKAVLSLQENFSTAIVEGLRLGDFEVSARKALLELELSFARMPLDGRSHYHKMSESLEVDFEHSDGESISLEKGGSARVKGKLTETGASLGIEASDSKTNQEHSSKSTVGGSDEVPNIAAGGSSERPSWRYYSRGASPTLVGGLGFRELGKIDYAAIPFFVRIRVKMNQRDFEFSGLSGLLPGNIPKDPNKSSIARILIWKWLKPQVHPFIIDKLVEVR